MLEQAGKEHPLRKFVVLLGLFLPRRRVSPSVTIVFTLFQPQGWQVGYPYTATINGVPGFSVMCDDWAHGGQPGQTWKANFTDLGSGDLSCCALISCRCRRSMTRLAGCRCKPVRRHWPSDTILTSQSGTRLTTTRPSPLVRKTG